MAAPKLKDLFHAGLVRELAAEFRAAHPAFDAESFIEKGAHGLDGLELSGRAWHLAELMHEHLPQPFSQAADVLVAVLQPQSVGSPLRYMPHGYYIQKYGLADFESAMRAQYQLTQRFTAEWSIRPYLEKYPELTYSRLQQWALDPSPHVRRLVSEGTRPRLPWAPRLRAFQSDPSPVLALLELLKDDPERYVQRSVANNLNDIAKDHPDLAVETCRRWAVDPSPARAWIVKHALRSLVKQGHRGALASLGAGGKPAVRVSLLTLTPRRAARGGEVRFACEVASAGRRAQDLIIDYAVHYVKANGDTRPKVFKLKALRLPPGEHVELRGRIALVEMTTRKHYPGRHAIDLRINGVVFPLTEFHVV